MSDLLTQLRRHQRWSGFPWLLSKRHNKMLIKQKPLEELYFFRGANEIHLCRLVIYLESII